MRKQYDILISVNGNLEWVWEIYRDNLEEAKADALHLVKGAKYVGFNEFHIIGGAWVKV